MDLSGIVSLAAAACQLALGVFAYRRGGRNPVARPLAMLCFMLATWNVVTWAKPEGSDGSGWFTWHVLDVVLAPWVVPLALHVVLGFVGQRRAHARLLLATYVYYGALSLSGALAPIFDWSRQWIDPESTTWEWLFLIPWVAVLSWSVWLLARHVRQSHGAAERMRGRLMMLAIGLAGAIACLTELIFDKELNVPSLGNAASVITVALFAIVILRLRLFGREFSASGALYAAGVGVFGLCAFLVLFALLEGDVALILGSLIITGLVVAAMMPVIVDAAERRQQTQRLAGLGRFAEQMAHDIKNPLAALKGSVQFLAEEHKQGRSLDEQVEFLELMLDQLGRVQSIVDRYQRLGSCEPRIANVDVNAVVSRVLALQPYAQVAGVRLEQDLGDNLTPCQADPDLLANAIENLVRNAAEAMPEGGTLTVRTRAAEDTNGTPRLVVSVEDEGVGMDARQRERVFDEFFTTKPDGSGLGLAFVRRVAEAHGGDVDLHSSVGIGTRVRFAIPREPPQGDE